MNFGICQAVRMAGLGLDGCTKFHLVQSDKEQKAERLLGTEQGNVPMRDGPKRGRTISPSLITRSPKALRSLWTPGKNVPRPARAATEAVR